MKQVRVLAVIAWSVVLATLMASTAGCGGDGDTSSMPPTNDNPPTLTNYVLFNRYDFNAGRTNSIVAIPRANPSLPGVSLTENYDDFLIAHRALLDTNGNMTGAIEAAGVIFFEPAAQGTGRWQRIGFTDAALQRTAVSSETAAPCVDFYRQSRLLERRLADERTSFVLYALAGPDGQCFSDDDTYWVIDYQASATAKPIALAGLRAVLGAIYRSDGSMDGLLALQDDDLVYISDLARFADRQLLASGVRAASVLLAGADEFHNAEQAFVVVQGTVGSAGIHRVGVGAQYSQTLHVAADQFSTFSSRADAQSLYIADQYFITLPSTATEPVTQLLRVPLSATAESASLIQTFSGYHLSISGLTENNVVLSGAGSDAIAMDAVYPKSPTEADTLKRLDGFVSYVSPARLYIAGVVGSNSSGSPISGAIEADESGKALAMYRYGQWFGLRYQSASAFPQDQRRPVDGALLAQGQSYDASGVRLQDANLYYVRPSQPLLVFRNADGSAFTLSERDGIIFEDAGAATELAGFDDGDPSSINFELLSLDFQSMHAERITSTADVDEFPVY
ncbi:hypothetical protein [Solimonas terrae]|uniref:Uncharacterized protein n=1 Tax=Solimonas terrae TaxID=1396819 RepID=A0A6M2BQ77_9GAMM|nr:hypothetical protein [Solimonas terrae]NGY04608.1 hypothetical protein [Solimonas terrae]